MSVFVGAAVMDVNVPVDTQMAGFAARIGPSEGVHDPLSVRALVVDDVAVVTVDVCALHEDTIAEIRHRLGEEVRESVIAATHTHSGPCIAFGRLGPHVSAVHDDIVHAVKAAVSTAVADRRRCKVLYAETAGLGIASNRRHSDSNSNPPAQALRFIDHSGSTRAWLVLYPCHPVVLDSSNRLISGDYLAAVRSQIEQATPASVCLFATGAAGDMNTGHSAEASYTTDVSGKRTFAEAELIGKVVAHAVLAATGQPIPVATIRTATKEVALSFDRICDQRALLERNAWQSELEFAVTPQRAALLSSWIDWSDALLSGEYDALGNEWPASVTAISIGDVILVTLPGEPFLITAERLRNQSKYVLVAAYTNGCPGYLPPAEEYAHGGYEVIAAHRYYGMPGPFAKGSVERLEAAANEAMNEVRQ